MNVEWLPDAEKNLNAQLDWIADRDPWAAIDMGDAILAAVDRLADFPAIARPGGWRARVNSASWGTPHIVVHRIETAAVVILRVLHGAHRWSAV